MRCRDAEAEKSGPELAARAVPLHVKSFLNSCGQHRFGLLKHVIPAQPSPTSDGHMYSNATLILPHIQSPAWNRGLAWNLVLWQMPTVKL